MYYPYFRGKQYDLLAIKSLLEENRLSQKVCPIIEPIKDSRTFQSFLKINEKRKHPIYVIDNPQTGQFLTESGLLPYKNRLSHTAHIVDQSLDVIEEKSDLWIVQQASPVLVSDWKEVTQKVVVPFEFRLLEKIPGDKILSEDPFTRLPKTSFYQENSDEFFSDSQNTFRKRGFSGFSDFSIDSRTYYEKGYPSPILSLHLVYFKENTLRIHHFLSPEEASSQSEKFFFLMEEISKWTDTLCGKEVTVGLSLLLKAFDNQHFPGMGIMRKASVMHHLELMSRFLDQQTE
ncbi:MAG TPA: sce7725 family protein [Candidatus Tetragenococcus pullicola]|nr:sce7725 family protein [Candidatus Tetragenococcus pullicola]